jgi:hypothetical protein
VDVFNRVLIVLMLLIAIVLCTLVLVLPLPVLDAVAQQSADLVGALERLQWYVRLSMGVLVALVLDAVFLLLIILELRRPSRRPIRVEKAAGGEVLISVASIADRIRYEVDQLPSILRTRPRVSGKRKGVVVALDVEAATGINVPDQAGQIVELVRRVVEGDMGLKLIGPPKVSLRVMSYPKSPKPPTGSEGVLPGGPAPGPVVTPTEIPPSPIGPTEQSFDEWDSGVPDLPEDLSEAL